MAKTIDETTKDVNQVYRTKEETQQAFSPRFSAQAGATIDATRDFESLMGSKASKMRQEHEVSAGIAKRMASDHLMSMNEEIAFINKTMKPGDSRNAAIQRLSSSIASTSGIAAGLTGDAAMEYDKTYIPSARKMATNAMSNWEKEQEDIDKAVLNRDFDTFLNLSNNMDSNTSSTVLAVWKTRLAPYMKNGDADVEAKAATATAQHLITDASKDPTLNANQRADLLKGKNFMGLAEVTEDGVIKFHTDNQEVKYILSKALAPIMQDAVDETLAVNKAYNKATLAANKKNITNLSEQNTAIRTRMKKTDNKDEIARLKGQLDRNTAAMGVMEQSDISIAGGVAKGFVDKLVKFETTDGSYTAENDSGAYGRYQIMPDTAKEYAGKLGIKYSEWKIPANQDKIFAKFTEENATALSRAGMETTEFNLWGAHNQGVKGFKEILSDKPLSVIRKKKIAANLPDDMEATKENYIKYWSEKWGGGKIETGKYSYSPGQSPIDMSKTALNALKNSLAFDTTNEKLKKDSITTIGGKMTSDKKHLMTQAKQSGDYSGVLKYMNESNSMFLEMAEKEHFTEQEINAVVSAQKVTDKAYNEKMFTGISKLLDSEVAGGATVDEAMTKIIPGYSEKLKGDGYGSISESVALKYNDMVIKENTGKTKPMAAREVAAYADNLNERNVDIVLSNIDQIKDEDQKYDIMVKVDKYTKSEQYQIDLSRNKPIGTYKIDIGRLNKDEKGKLLIREYKKMDDIFKLMSEGDANSARRFNDLLNDDNGVKLDGRILNYFVQNKILPYTKTPTMFYDAFKTNPGVLSHSRIKISMSEQPGKDGLSSLVKYNTFAILSRTAMNQGKDKIFEGAEELLFMDKLQAAKTGGSDVITEELQSNSKLQDFISNWSDHSGVQWQDREEIMLTANALALSGNTAMLGAIQTEVLGKYAKLDTSSFYEGISAGELITDRTKISYYSDSTLLAEFKGKSMREISNDAVRAIMDTGIDYEKALEYKEHIMDNGATYTRGDIPDENGNYEYYIVLEDDNHPAYKTKFKFVPGRDPMRERKEAIHDNVDNITGGWYE